jgi:hypothetical protein
MSANDLPPLRSSSAVSFAYLVKRHRVGRGGPKTKTDPRVLLAVFVVGSIDGVARPLFSATLASRRNQSAFLAKAALV